MRIDGNARANLKATWLFTVLWSTVCVPILYFIPPELHRNPLGAIGFVFPIAGAGLLVWAVLSTLRTRRFGNTWLEPTSGDAAPGARWTARVHARLPQPEAGAYAVVARLSCLLRTVSRSNRERTVHERIVWRDEMQIESSQIASGGDDAAVPVQFDIPADALETTVVGAGAGTLWVLTVEAALPGVNLREDFDVPVRRTAVVSAPAVHREAAIGIEDLARAGITVEPSPDGTSYRFAPMRNRGFAVGVTAFTALLTGAVWLQLFVGFPLVFPILTGLFDLLLVYTVLDLWCGVTVVVAGNGTLRVRHTVLGAGATRTLAAPEVAAIDLHINMQTEGRYGTPYYAVRATLKNGRKTTLGDGIRNKRHAEWLAGRMREAVGVR